MKRLSFLMFAILVLAGSLIGQGVVDSTKKDQAPAGQQVNKGNLFSAILFAETPLGERWARLRPEAERLFPALKMKAVSDLHVTIIYIGKEWSPENIDTLRNAMAVHIADTIPLIPEVVAFGRNNQVVVVELKGVPEAFQAQVVGVKASLNAAGLKKQDLYDTSFRAHVTLAEAKKNPPNEQEKRELDAFREWVVPRLDVPSLRLRLDPSMPIRLLLAGATRPDPVPEYIAVEDFLNNVPATRRTEPR